MHQWMNKERVGHIHHGIVLAIEILLLAATWMDLKIIMLSEISRAQKDTYRMISHVGGILKR